MSINLAWLYAITKYGYPPSLNNMYNAIDDAARLGFKAIELEVYREGNLIEVEKNKKQLKEHIESKRLRTVNLAAIFPELLSAEDNVRDRGLQFFERTSELAAFFEAPMTQTDTFTPPVEYIGRRPYSTTVAFGERYRVKIPPGFSWNAYWKRIVEVLRRCSRIAGQYDLKLAVEPRVGENVSNSDLMLRLIEEVGEDNFGAVLDAGHLHAQKELIPLSIEKLNRKIVYVHASDNDGRDNFHLAPGKGTIDWDAVFEGLKKYEFSGYIAIDVGGQDIKDRLDQEVLEGRKFVEKMGRKHSLW